MMDDYLLWLKIFDTTAWKLYRNDFENTLSWRAWDHQQHKIEKLEQEIKELKEKLKKAIEVFNSLRRDRFTSLEAVDALIDEYLTELKED